jgi:2-polyprenyl-3-methyl-5-hydroxy-6-metoxy-1,4-benzoquinol methylase
VFILPRPNKEELSFMYSDEYFLHDGADCGAHSMTDYETAAQKGSVKFPEILGAIKKFRDSGDFFEVGCGMGYFLAYARTQGYSVSGIEYAALGTKVAREKFGLNVVQSSFEDLPVTESAHDVIFFGDVLEHLLEPLEMMRKAHRMTKHGGVVAAEVPSMFNSIVGRGAIVAFRALGRSKRMPMPPYHVNEFTPATLRAMFRAAGFSQVTIVQRTKKPDTIALRGTLIEKGAKKGLQYPNYLITKMSGLLGDRLLGIGVKEGAF